PHPTNHPELKLLATLEPDHLAPNVCHWLAIAMPFQALKAWRVGHRYVAQYSAVCPIEFNNPAGRAWRLIELRQRRPERPLGAEVERIDSPQAGDCSQVL